MLQVVLSIFKYSVVCSLSLLQLYYNMQEMKCKGESVKNLLNLTESSKSPAEVANIRLA